MKKKLLLVLTMVWCFNAIAQEPKIKRYLPSGIQRAKLTQEFTNSNTKVRLEKPDFDNAPAQGPVATTTVPLRTASLLTSDEFLVGNTFYDLQTNTSISNRLVVSDDGTISAAWTFSPTNLRDASNFFPDRGTGYNYWNGTDWLYPNGPTQRQESVRTGFTNIVVTPISELTVNHSIVNSSQSQIAVNRRSTKGSGPWTLTFPWGPANDTWAKAVSAGTSGPNNNVYVIFQGAGTSTVKVEGQIGPIYFSKSTDGGATWTPKAVIPEIDSTKYYGFSADTYSIDAKGDVVAITAGTYKTDLLLLKSTDAGATWVKTLIQKHPIPFFDTCTCGTFYLGNDTLADTVYSNAADAKVLIDNANTCHVWFTPYDYYDQDSTTTAYNIPYVTDDLIYWNETMGADTGGARTYVSIASSIDYNGNGKLDIPSKPLSNCIIDEDRWGVYGYNNVTQMPSAGIDANGTIYMTYQSIAEVPQADTGFYHIMHRHVYMKSLAPVNGVYDPSKWSIPYDIIPTVALGGDGFNQEGVFACTARRVDDYYAYVLYQRDNAPGHSLGSSATDCANVNNSFVLSDFVLTRVDKTEIVGVKNLNSNFAYITQNYPNPVKGMTYVNIGLKKAAKVNVEVYDMVGKLVYSESKGMLATGGHSISFNTSNWEAGVYTYSIIAGGEKTSNRMIVQ